MLSEVFSKASRCVEEERTGLFVYGPHALPRHKASKKAGDHVKTAQPPPKRAMYHFATVPFVQLPPPLLIGSQFAVEGYPGQERRKFVSNSKHPTKLSYKYK